ncbi:MAG: hypothetical protein LLG00_04530 [Planctomycetaceae bacterium]|nr:hypothetical protein [Planctomycetaceae bacterium]
MTDFSPLPTTRNARCLALAEIALIFAVFFLQGAWPAPDVNEPYYLGKAIHYWNPDWLRGDFFMETPDAHRVFNLGFGWLSLWLSPAPLAWTGRILTWLLLAWAWRRLSWAIVPRAWYSVLTAALFGWLMEHCHMAGEWVVGGVEAKGFAYVLVFFGLEAIVRNRWNRGLLCLGAASALHVVVGGWSAVAAGIAWVWLHSGRSVTLASPHLRPLPKGEGTILPLRSLWPGLLGGALLALPGIIPSLMLDWGASRETARQAHEIYVFERLPHHLLITAIQPWFVARLGLLCGLWLLLGRWERRHRDENVLRLRAFVTGAVVIALCGAALSALVAVNRGLAANLLRFYWFRLADVALPLAVSLEAARLLLSPLAPRPKREGRPTFSCVAAWSLVAGVVLYQVGGHAIERIVPGPPRSEKMASPTDWEAACRWAANSGTIRPHACFLVPRVSQTFSWYSGHGAVVTWKDVPQDAKGLVEWWRRVNDIYATGLPPTEPQWHDSLSELRPERLQQLGARYNAVYAITDRTDPPLNLERVYENSTYVIYQLTRKGGPE